MQKMMFVAIKNDDQEKTLANDNLSEEETATQSPRSTLDSAYNESSVQTPRSSAKSDDSIDGGFDNSYQDEYDAFLREMAGSFVQEDDSGSEGGSEDGAGTGDEGEEPEPDPMCRKITRDFSPAVPADNGVMRYLTKDSGRTAARQSPHLSPASGQARQDGSSLGVTGPVCQGILGKETLPRAVSSSQSGARSREREGSDSHDRERSASRAPSRDLRGPVEDDYDVVQAIQDFAAQRAGSRLEQRREDLQALIDEKKHQACSLLGVASSPNVGLALREHYTLVHDELLTEARKYEAELATLDEEAEAEERQRRQSRLLEGDPRCELLL